MRRRQWRVGLDEEVESLVGVQAAHREQALAAVSRHGRENGLGARQGKVHRVGNDRQSAARHMLREPICRAPRQGDHTSRSRVGQPAQALPEPRQRLGRRMRVFGRNHAAWQARAGQDRQHRSRRHHGQHDIRTEGLDHAAQGPHSLDIAPDAAQAPALARRMQYLAAHLGVQGIDVALGACLRHHHYLAAHASPMRAQVGGYTFRAPAMQRVDEQQDARRRAGIGHGHSIGLFGFSLAHGHREVAREGQ